MLQKSTLSFHKKPAIPCPARRFDLLRNSPTTVSTYADECELLALTASLTSASLSKISFLTGCEGIRHRRMPSVSDGQCFCPIQKHWMKKIVGGDRSGSRSRAPKSLSPYDPLPTRVLADSYYAELPTQDLRANTVIPADKKTAPPWSEVLFLHVYVPR